MRQQQLTGKRKKRLFLPIMLLAVFVCMCMAMYILNPVYEEMEEIYFYDLDGNRMTGNYIQGTKGEGAILVADKGQDMSYYLNMAQTLNKQGYSVMIYDLPGQGRSQGSYSTSFYEDNSCAMQVYSAMLAFSQLCKLPPANIHYIGHGYGARAILQACSVDYINPVSITLINPEISFKSSVLASLPIIADDTALDWFKDMGQNIKDTNVHIISNSEKYETCAQLKDVLSTNNTTQLDKEFILLEPFAPLSKNIINSTVSYVSTLSAFSYSSDSNLILIYNIMLAVMLLLIFGIVLSFIRAFDTGYDENERKYELSLNFYLYKLLLWIPAAVLGAMGFAIGFIIPIGYPVQTAMISFVFGAYGVIMLFLYVYSNFANDAGDAMFIDEQRVNWIGGFFLFAMLFVMLKMFGHFSLYYMFPFSERWIWFVLFTIANSITFLIIDREIKALNPDKKSKNKLVIVMLLPFALASILLLALGIAILAVTLVISAIAILLIIMFGRVLAKINTHIYIAALFQGILFTALLLSFGITIG